MHDADRLRDALERLVHDGAAGDLNSLEVGEPLRWPKGSTWLLRRTEPHVRARYLPPLALDPVHAR
jgi:hypothetical protein